MTEKTKRFVWIGLLLGVIIGLGNLAALLLFHPPIAESTPLLLTGITAIGDGIVCAFVLWRERSA